MIHNLFKIKNISFFILAILLIISLINIPAIKIDADISQFFHEGDQDYELYQELKSEFANQEDVILLGIKTKDSSWSTDALIQLDSLSKKLKQHQSIEKVSSILTISYPVKTSFGLIPLPYINQNKEDEYQVNIRKIKNEPLLKSFISKETLFMWIEIVPDLDPFALEKLIGDINIIREQSQADTFLWGREVVDVSFKNILVQEIGKFLFWVILFLCVSLLLIFKRPIAIVFPIVLVLVVIILFLGGMAALNRPLTTMSNLLPTIILIVAVSDVVHLCIKFDTESEKGLPIKKAIRNTISEIGFTTFITSFTTAVGFMVLYFSPIKAIRHFGVESAFLVVLTFILTLIFLPFYFSKIRDKHLFQIRNNFSNLSEKLNLWLHKIYKKPNQVLFTFAVLLIISSFGIQFISKNRSHYSIPENTDLYASYQFFEKKFGGSRTFELIVSTPDSYSLLDSTLFMQVLKIEDYLGSKSELNELKSPVNYYRQMQNASIVSINKTDIDLNSLKEYDKKLALFMSKDYLANSDRTRFKFSAQMKDLGSEKMAAFEKEILLNVSEIVAEHPLKAQLSGIDLLIGISQEKSIKNTFIGLLIAIIIVSITLSLVFRNIALGALAIVLNIIPLVITAGIMGYFGVELRAEIALIFTVGFVIAVDDTIHLLSKFQWERRKGSSIEDAIKKAVLECGKAILATSIILMGGFFMLMQSISLEIYTLGVLVGLIVFITLVVDLILAPIIVLKFFKKFL